MEPTKINFFKQLFYAVAKPKKYNKLSQISGGRMTGFVFLFILLVTICSTVIPGYNTLLGSNGILNVMEEKVPDFELKDGVLYVAERYENIDNNSYILVDTNIEEFYIDEINTEYEQVILVSKTNYVSYQSGKTQAYDFSTLKTVTLDKGIIQDMKPLLILFFVIGMVLVYLFGVGMYFLTGLLFALVGLIINSLCNTYLTFGSIFKIAIYSKVTAKIFFTLVGFLPISVPGLLKTIISIIITIIYIVFGIMAHKLSVNEDGTFIDTRNDN